MCPNTAGCGFGSDFALIFLSDIALYLDTEVPTDICSAHLTPLEGPKKNLASRTACTYIKPNRLSMAHPQSGSPGPLGKSPVRPCVVSVWCRAVPCGVVSHVSHDAGRTPVRTSAVRRPCVGLSSLRYQTARRPYVSSCRLAMRGSSFSVRTRTRTRPYPYPDPYIPRTYPVHTPYEPVPTYGHEPVPEPVRITDLNPYRTRT